MANGKLRPLAGRQFPPGDTPTFYRQRLRLSNSCDGNPGSIPPAQDGGGKPLRMPLQKRIIPHGEYGMIRESYIAGPLNDGPKVGQNQAEVSTYCYSIGPARGKSGFA